MQLPSSRAVFCVVLAGWLLAVTSAGALRHAHANGEIPHSHGFGLVCPHPAHHPGHSTWHRHLILLGLELFETEDGDPVSPENDGWTFGLAVTVKADPVALAPADVPLPLPDVANFSSPLLPLEPVGAAAATTDPPSLCVSACHARSGVLRT